MKASIAAMMLLVTLQSHADLVVSLRYFKTEGTSHYHLYLYRDDGKVARQLTAPEDAHDTNPIFSRDGSEIAFTREVKGGSKIMSIHPDGSAMRALAQVPAWYHPTESSDAYELSGGGDNDSLWKSGNGELSIAAPDGKTELVLKNADNLKIQESFDAISFRALTIRDTAGGKETRVLVTGDIPDNYCDFAMRQKSPFLLCDNLRVVFYWQWLGSTDGSRLGVLDLDKQKAIFLSANPAMAIPHGTRAGFFCVSHERYQPLPGTKKTVNCLYLDWWDAGLKRTRFAKAISLFGGASVRVKGQPQLEIPTQVHP
jgi:hypothetical protein